VKKQIVNKCADLFRLTPEDLVGRKRRKYVTYARFALYTALRRRGWSYLAIGAFLGRDHATIMYGVRAAEYLIERDEEYAEKVQTLVDLKPEWVAQETKQ
jgi:chromosomal replication initiation ATPase DnaA